MAHLSRAAKMNNVFERRGMKQRDGLGGGVEVDTLVVDAHLRAPLLVQFQCGRRYCL